jgi:hypothetical protein
MTIIRLSRLFAGRGLADLSGTFLPLIAFAVATGLIVVVAGGAQAFFSWTDDAAIIYQALAVVALILLVIPLATLGGAAARLSARHRDDRLASLRLLGATPAFVAILTVIESAVLALAGALAGVASAFVARPLVGMIPFRGSPLGDSVLLGPAAVGSIIAGVVVLAAISAAIGLRGVILSPIGVRTRQNVPKPHWLRAAGAVIVIALAYALMSIVGLAGEKIVVFTVLVIGVGGSIAVLNLVGPWILRLIAVIQVRLARTARRLLAARSILESPKAAWRQVSGVAMTSFMAVFAGVAVSAIGTLRDNAASGEAAHLPADIRTGLIVTVVTSFLMVACSAGVNQAAAILDRRDLYISLDRVGMPVSEMNAARSLAVLSPLRITAIGSAVTAGIVMLPLTGLSVIVAPISIIVILGCIAFGIALVWIALLATRPVLKRVLSEQAPTL